MDCWQRALRIETKQPTDSQALEAQASWAPRRLEHFKRRVEFALAQGARPLLRGENDYPVAWQRLKNPPVGVWINGHWDQDLRRVGIVGARAAPPHVRTRVERYAKQCTAEGEQVVSGAAVGVDTAAHLGARNSGSVGVIPFGIEVERVGQGQLPQHLILGDTGTIFCASLLRHGARARYVARNQLLAALCDRLVVAYAALRSGSMHTVRFSQQLGLPIEAWWEANDPPSNNGCRSLHRYNGPEQSNLRDLLKALQEAKGVLARLPKDESGSRSLALFELECDGWIRRVGPGQYDCERK